MPSIPLAEPLKQLRNHRTPPLHLATQTCGPPAGGSGQPHLGASQKCRVLGLPQPYRKRTCVFTGFPRNSRAHSFKFGKLLIHSTVQSLHTSRYTLQAG